MTAKADADAVLAKAARENFPVAPRFLPRAWRDDLMAVYGYARLVDDIGDGDLGGPAATRRHAAHLGLAPEQAGDTPAMLDAFEADLNRVQAAAAQSPEAEGPRTGDVHHPADASRPADAPRPDGGPRHPVLAALVPAVRRGRLPPEPFQHLIEANRRDVKIRRCADYPELLAYCELSANPVGRLVLALTGTATPERVRRSDAVCTALQIIEHLQDVSEDLLVRDRIYLPGDDMARFSVGEAELAAPGAGAAVRTLIAFEAERARLLLAEGVPLVHSVHGRLRLLLAGFVGGGLATLRAIRAAGYDVLAGPVKPTTPGLLREAAATLRSKG